MKFVSLIMFVSSAANAIVTSANDPNRGNMKIESAYSDGQGHTIVALSYQIPFAMDGKQPTPNPSFIGTNLLLSCDAERCDQLDTYGQNGNSFEGHYSLKDGNDNVFDFNLDPKTGTYGVKCPDGLARSLKPIPLGGVEALQAKLRSGSLPISSLPREDRIPVAALKQTDGSYIYIDRAEHAHDSASQDYRIYEGAPGAMREVKLKTDNDRFHVRELYANFTLADGRRIVRTGRDVKVGGKVATDLSDESEIASITPKERRESGDDVDPSTPCPDANEDQKRAAERRADAAAAARAKKKGTAATPKKRLHRRHRRHHTTPANSSSRSRGVK